MSRLLASIKHDVRETVSGYFEPVRVVGHYIGASTKAARSSSRSHKSKKHRG